MRFVWIVLLSAAAIAQQVPRQAPPLNLLQACKGRVTVAAFIVTECPHCKAFARNVLEPLYESGKACAIAAAFDADGDIDRFAREQKIRFPLFRIERGMVRRFLGIAGPDRPIGTPQVVVIDKLGRIWAQSQPEGSPLLLQPEVIRQIVERLQ